MEADFSGWATKAGLTCSDGRTIMPDAFKHQDKVQVPLVWQHGHKDPENVLGHAILENRPEGVYCQAYFNNTPKAKHAKALVEHNDINMLSIWANELLERSKKVHHGSIREVSLVLSGANPGARIDNVNLRHSDGEIEELEDEVIIFTGLNIEHGSSSSGDGSGTKVVIEEPVIDDDKQKIIDSMTDEQKALFHSMMEALGHDGTADMTVEDVYNTMSDLQKQVVNYMIGEALSASGDQIQQDNLGDDTDDDPKGDIVKHNVFDRTDEGAKPAQHVLSHSDMESILDQAKKGGSLAEAVKAYAADHLEHGIEDIDVLFPVAKTLADTPELFGRRVEWVADFMGKVRKSPFARIKTISGDITAAEARAKGYITGTLKKEEFFKVKSRVTVPQTIYKRQKLDRDDMIDITDFDVVAWLKGEMRLMLDEELARACLMGDGRAADDEDKIDEERIRPIAGDHELYTTVVNVNIGDSSSSITEALDAIVANRRFYRGSGLPTLYTTEIYISKFLLLKDTLGRKIYRSLDEVASDLRVAAIVPVEALQEYTDIIGIMVNPVDYVIGADNGGQVSMFDNFDIDYNQFRYLIETRCSGALVKLKSAIVIKSVAGADVLVAPAAPTFDGTHVTIHNTTGVVYRNADTDAVITAAGSPYTVAEGETLNVHAEPADGYFFESSNVDDWSFTNEA